MTEGAYPDCITFATPRARKSHCCCECGRTIQPGETYQRVSGVWEGEPGRFKTCMKCVDLAARFRRHVEYDYNPPFGYLRECMAEEGVTEANLMCQQIAKPVAFKGREILWNPHLDKP